MHNQNIPNTPPELPSTSPTPEIKPVAPERPNETPHPDVLPQKDPQPQKGPSEVPPGKGDFRIKIR